ncbi:hypothetical protein GGI15_004860 [Coemansia interrupta]|uniref:Uncharacterized protein n=1 Tax=Coemansia interrupta TaxID=1126814 RepID=A0A9W8H0T6_9FUNG|nr:hypothetical protein GGI15_004860 [Coemansia interrupta]
MSFGGFGAASTSGGLFGSTGTSAAPASGGLFGSASSSAAPASGGLFGSTNASAAPASGGLFGSTNASAAPASGGLFGSAGTSAAPASGGLFGSAGTSAAPASSGLFGSTNTSAAPASGGLFGSASTSAAPASTGLFGSTNASAAPASTSLFGSTNASAAPASGGLFGSTNTSAAPAAGGLFGATNTSAVPASSGLFGATNTTAAPASTGLFGAAANPAPANPAPASATPAITRKTKYVDLSSDVQKMLLDIERQKQVQVQIGSGIAGDSTSREAGEVSSSIQRLAQELEIVRMTLASDRGLVDDARARVSFAVRHAEKAAALVAHATDDGSWAQSGLTPLQVASRQRALQALQGGGGAASAAAGDDVLRLAEAVDARQEAKQGDGAVDAYEAVRRIQFASMHHGVASEYYWAWLARVEASAQLLAERLDQAERHVAGALASCDASPASGGMPRPSPRAVADVIQHQNDSFLAIAGRVAALDDDVRRLRKRLGLAPARQQLAA